MKNTISKSFRSGPFIFPRRCLIGLLTGLFLAVLLLPANSTGIEKKTGVPKSNGDGASTTPQIDSASPSIKAMVIKISGMAKDELPLISLPSKSPGLTNFIYLSSTPAPQLIIGKDVTAAIKKGESSDNLFIAKGIKELKDVNFIIIRHIEYQGKGRHGFSEHVSFEKELGAFPEYSTPKSVLIGVWDPPSKLMDILPWPKKMAWEITDDNRLSLSASKKWEIKPGGELKLPAVKETVNIRAEFWAPVKLGDQEGALKENIIEKDLGKINFESEITIHFYGKIPVREATR